MTNFYLGLQKLTQNVTVQLDHGRIVLDCRRSAKTNT